MEEGGEKKQGAHKIFEHTVKADAEETTHSEGHVATTGRPFSIRKSKIDESEIGIGDESKLDKNESR